MKTQESATSRLTWAWLAFLAVRVLYLATQSRTWVYQDFEYGEIADNFLRLGRFIYDHDGVIMPTAYIPPGVFFVIVVMKKFFLLNHYFLAWACLHLGIAASTFGLFLTLCRRILSPGAVAAGAVIYILDVNLLSPMRWINETIFSAFLSMLLAVGLQRIEEEPSVRQGVIVGIALGVGSLFRPTFLAFALFAAVWMGYLAWKQGPARPRVQSTLAMLLTMIALMAPWTIRNYIVFKRVVPVSLHSGLNLWQGWNPQSGGSNYQLNGDPMVMEPWLKEKVRQATSEPEMKDILTQAAVDYAWQNPGRWLRQRVFSFLFFWHEHTFWAPHSPFRTRKAFVLGVFNLALLFFFFWSVPVAWKTGGFLRTLLLLICLHALIYTLVHADIGNRYRLQIEPWLLVPMANFFGRFVRKKD